MTQTANFRYQGEVIFAVNLRWIKGALERGLIYTQETDNKGTTIHRIRIGDAFFNWETGENEAGEPLTLDINGKEVREIKPNPVGEEELQPIKL
jgi:hypothetical protein